jgi:hypothetical protein
MMPGPATPECRQSVGKQQGSGFQSVILMAPNQNRNRSNRFILGKVNHNAISYQQLEDGYKTMPPGSGVPVPVPVPSFPSA